MQQQTQTTLTEWAKQENERMESLHKQAMDERDYKPFLKLQVGKALESSEDEPNTRLSLCGRLQNQQA